MSKVNLHTHTTYCDGFHTPRELVEEAVKLGCPAIGFSGHSHTPFDESYCMSVDGTEAYKREIRELKAEYRGVIDVYLGIEQDYYGDLSTADYDFVIGSVHYIKAGLTYLPIDEAPYVWDIIQREYFGGDTYAIAEAYFETVADVYRKTGCDIIGHFDLITKFNEGNRLFDESHPRYQKAAWDALYALAKTPALFEVNVGDVARGRKETPFPSPQYIEYLEQNNHRLIYTTDCHDKALLVFGLPDTDVADFTFLK